MPSSEKSKSDTLTGFHKIKGKKQNTYVFCFLVIYIYIYLYIYIYMSMYLCLLTGQSVYREVSNGEILERSGRQRAFGHRETLAT